MLRASKSVCITINDDLFHPAGLEARSVALDDTQEKATLADDIRDIILDGLREPVPAIGYYFGRRLEETHPGKCVLEGVSPSRPMRMPVTAF